jgi:hypothetical protein
MAANFPYVSGKTMVRSEIRKTFLECAKKTKGIIVITCSSFVGTLGVLPAPGRCLPTLGKVRLGDRAPDAIRINVVKLQCFDIPMFCLFVVCLFKSFAKHNRGVVLAMHRC